MTVCACFMVWAGWMKTTEESLAICLSRRNLPPSVMLPSQLRTIRNFDAIMHGTHPLGDALRLSRVTITNVPDVETGSCSPFIEIYNQNKLVFSSYRKGSKTRGSVEPVNADDTVVFKSSVVLRVGVLSLSHIGKRVRSLPSFGRERRFGDSVPNTISHGIRSAI